MHTNGLMLGTSKYDDAVNWQLESDEHVVLSSNLQEAMIAKF